MDLKPETGFGKTIFLLASSLFAAVLVLIRTSGFGAGITHDSVAYVYAAESVISGKGFVYFGYGTPFVQWPPLFPVLLAGAQWLGIDMLEAARFLNAVVQGLILLFSGIWLSGRLKSKVLFVAAQLTLVFSMPLLYVAGYVWTEPLFILFSILFLTMLGDYSTSRRRADLLWASVFCALACLTRYIGVTLIAAGVIILLLVKEKTSRRLKDILLFGFVSSTPLAAWLIRNYAVFSSFAGTREASRYTLVQNIRAVFDTVASWFVPSPILAGTLRGVMGAAAAAVILAALLFLAGQALKIAGRGGIAAGTDPGLASVLPHMCILAVYTVYLAVSAARVAIDAISNRLMAPVYISLILLLFFAADRVLGMLKNRGRTRIIGGVLIVVVCVWLVYPLSTSIVLLKKSIDSGAGGYSSEKWKYSEMINYLKEQKTQCQVYSNNPDAIRILAGIPAEYTPKNNGPEQYGFERFREKVNNGDCSIVVWFDSGPAGTILSPADLNRFFVLETVEEKADGTIYEIR